MSDQPAWHNATVLDTVLPHSAGTVAESAHARLCNPPLSICIQSRRSAYTADHAVLKTLVEQHVTCHSTAATLFNHGVALLLCHGSTPYTQSCRADLTALAVAQDTALSGELRACLVTKTPLTV